MTAVLPVGPNEGDRGWMINAACRGFDGEIFFPEQHDSKELIEKAKEVCRPCPVRHECLEYALENRIWWGIWGCTSGRERIRLARNRRKAFNSRRSPTPLSRTGDLLTERNPT